MVPPDPDPVIDPEGPAIAAHAQQQSSTSEPAGTDFSADASTEGRIAVDDSVTGAVGTSGDVDWFAVELVAGRVYCFVAEPLHHVDERLSTPEVHLISPDGEALESGGLALSFSGPNGSGFYMFSEFEFVATETGTHHVAVSALGGLSRTGAYDLSVSEIPDDYDDRPATGGSVDVGGSEGGEVDFAGDRDWFAVELEAGRELSARPRGLRHRCRNTVRSLPVRNLRFQRNPARRHDERQQRGRSQQSLHLHAPPRAEPTTWRPAGGTT